MADKKFKDTLEALLKKDSRLVDENKELNLAAIRDLADKTDSKLIELLLSNDETTKKFFLRVPAPNSSGKDVLVFKQNDFKFFLDSNKIDNSYTAYENRIGLASGNRLLKDIGDVVLNFPFKDCVLEGGQSTEEGMDEFFEYNAEEEKYELNEAQRKEIFFNGVLAQDEIDRLFEAKAFTNIKKYTAKGEEKINSFARDENGTITDNLIIKGNNLLALHSLKEEFTGQIKLIYIDPPYNTNSAANTFLYNNSFNHSSWMTFMKNRLEVSRELLDDDGILAISIDHYELFYLGVLADEIFSRDNRMGVIVVVHNPGGRQDDYFFPTAHENMLFYAKNITRVKLNTLGVSEEKLSEYKFSDKYGRYKLRGFRRSGNNSLRSERPGLYYPIYYNSKTNLFSLKNETKNDIELLPIDEKGVERCWRWGSKKFINDIDKYIELKKNKKGYEIYIKERESDYEGEKAKTIWDKPYYTGQSGTTELKNIFGEKVFSYPKSPRLIKDVIKIATDKNGLIIDYFGGSGTTAQAVLDLNKEDGGNRKFILVEQLDYVKDVTVKRVHQVIKNNKNGSFVYLELKKWNEEAKEKITDCKSLKELEKLLNELSDKYFLHYNVKFKEFQEKIIHEENFKKLPLKKQQEMFCKMLDLNQLYVNASEMEDKKYGLSKEDIALTKNFYNL